MWIIWTFLNAAVNWDVIINSTLGTALLDALRQAGFLNLKGKMIVDTDNPTDYSMVKDGRCSH